MRGIIKSKQQATTDTQRMTEINCVPSRSVKHAEQPGCAKGEEANKESEGGNTDGKDPVRESEVMDVVTAEVIADALQSGSDACPTCTVFTVFTHLRIPAFDVSLRV